MAKVDYVLQRFVPTRSLSSLLTKKQDTKMAQNIDNKQDAKIHLLDKLSAGAVICFFLHKSK